jgi:hypothetical protein
MLARVSFLRGGSGVSVRTTSPNAFSVAHPTGAAAKPRQRRGRPKGTRRRTNPLWWAHFLVTVWLAKQQHRGLKPPNKSELAKLIKKTSDWPEHRYVTVGRLRQYLSHPDFLDLPAEECFKFVTQMSVYWVFILCRIMEGIQAEIDHNPRYKAMKDQISVVQKTKTGRQIAEVAGKMVLAAWKQLQTERKAEGKPLLPKSYLSEELNRAASLPACAEFALPVGFKAKQLAKLRKI